MTALLVGMWIHSCGFNAGAVKTQREALERPCVFQVQMLSPAGKVTSQNRFTFPPDSTLSKFKPIYGRGK